MTPKKNYTICKGENGLNYINCFSVDGLLHVTKQGNSNTENAVAAFIKENPIGIEKYYIAFVVEV